MKFFLYENEVFSEDLMDVPVSPAESKHFELGKKLNSLINTRFPDFRMPLVGGACRDLLARKYLNHQAGINDLDYALYHEGGVGVDQKELQELKNFIETETDYSVVDEIKFFHLKVITKDKYEIEYTSTRKETYRDTSRKPETVVGTVDDDIMRRDFTINAIYLDVVEVQPDKVFIKPVGSRAKEFVQDIKDRVLKTTTDPEQVFSDDPLRILRAARFGGYGYKMSDDMRNVIDKYPTEDIMKKVSMERISDELGKILKKGDLDFLLQTGFVDRFIEAFKTLRGKPNEKEVITHTIQVIKQARVLAPRGDDQRFLSFLLAGLLHDVGKATGDEDHAIGSAAVAQTILPKLKFPAVVTQRVKRIIELHTQIKSLQTGDVQTMVEFIMDNAGKGKALEEILEDTVAFNEMNWGAYSDQSNIEELHRKQTELVTAISDYQKAIANISNQYASELKQISIEVSQNPQIPTTSRMTVIRQKKIDFIVNKIKDMGL